MKGRDVICGWFSMFANSVNIFYGVDEKVSKTVEREKEGNLRNLLIHHKLEERLK